jgi:plastocyanin
MIMKRSLSRLVSVALILIACGGGVATVSTTTTTAATTAAPSTTAATATTKGDSSSDREDDYDYGTATTKATTTTAAATTTTAAATTTTAAATTTTGATTTTQATTTTTAPAAGSTVTIGAENFAFSPATVTIKAGDTVQWVLRDGSHTTTSGTFAAPDGRWNQVITADAPVSIKFDQPGQFLFYCRFHPDSMRGTVVVEP